MLGENKLEDARICFAVVRDFEGFIQMSLQDVKGILSNATECLGDKEILRNTSIFCSFENCLLLFI